VNRTIHKTLMAALVLPLVVIVGFHSAWAAFACRIDGQVRDHCCCEANKTKREKLHDDAPPSIASRCCCDVSIHEAPAAPVVRELERASFGFTPLVVPTVTFTIAAPRVEHLTTIVTMARPPPPRLALYLDKQALLR
jgi:hypothetical protein